MKEKDVAGEVFGVYYRNERGMWSHFVALLGALLGGVVLSISGFILGCLYLNYISPGNEGPLEGIGYFLFTAGVGSVLGVWLGQPIGCALLLRLCRYELAGLTSLLLFGSAPIGLAMGASSLCLLFERSVPQNYSDAPQWWATNCFVVMYVSICFGAILLMPLLARGITLAIQRVRWAKVTNHFYESPKRSVTQ